MEFPPAALEKTQTSQWLGDFEARQFWLSSCRGTCDTGEVFFNGSVADCSETTGVAYIVPENTVDSGDCPALSLVTTVVSAMSCKIWNKMI